jgi:hypothetical protein
VIVAPQEDLCWDYTSGTPQLMYNGIYYEDLDDLSKALGRNKSIERRNKVAEKRHKDSG